MIIECKSLMTIMHWHTYPGHFINRPARELEWKPPSGGLPLQFPNGSNPFPHFILWDPKILQVVYRIAVALQSNSRCQIFEENNCSSVPIRKTSVLLC